jgi:hypothetical protein
MKQAAPQALIAATCVPRTRSRFDDVGAHEGRGGIRRSRPLLVVVSD